MKKIIILLLLPISTLANQPNYVKKYDVCVEIAEIRMKRKMKEYEDCQKKSKKEKIIVSNIQKKLKGEELNFFILMNQARYYSGCMNPKEWDSVDLNYCNQQIQNDYMKLNRKDLEKLNDN
jgi:hypothetical protein